MNRRYLFGLISGIVFILALSYILLVHKPALENNGKLRVTTSFYPLYFFAQEIGGDKADVFNIIPAGGEPHDYELTASDIVSIENSRILILNGGGLEPWAQRINDSLDPKNTLLITAGQGLDTARVTENGQNIIDPHIWLSPTVAEKMVDNIELGYENADPINAAYYHSKAEALKSRLADLDGEYQKGLANCASRNFITSHAAFGYLASAYKLNQVPIAGLSPDAEPSSQQLLSIAKFAKDNDVGYIFFESLAAPKLSQTIASEIGAKTLVLNPIEGLTKGEINAGRDYFTVMRDNLTNLRIALRCQ